MVAHSFKKCGISNSINGTEDNILWEEDADPEQESENGDSEDNVYDDVYVTMCMTTGWPRNSGKAYSERAMMKMNLRDFSAQVCVLKKQRLL